MSHGESIVNQAVTIILRVFVLFNSQWLDIAAKCEKSVDFT